MEVDPVEHLNKRPQIPWIVPGLLFVSVVVNLLYPGEVFFQSKYILILCSLLAVLIGALQEDWHRRWSVLLQYSLLTFLPLLVVSLSLLGTINSYRSWEVFWIWLAYACMIFGLQLTRIDTPKLTLFIMCLVLVTFVVVLVALHQYFLGFSHLHSVVARSHSLDEGFKAALQGRIATQRVFANFALPNSLAGVIVVILPLQLFLLHASLSRSTQMLLSLPTWVVRILKSRLTAVFVAIQILFHLLVLALTQSFGGWICMLVSMGVLGATLVSNGKFTRKRVAGPLIVGIVLAMVWVAWLTSRRGFGLLDLKATENPVALRWVNFRTAWRIFLDFPCTGVGLGNYGSINPLYQDSATKVTQYTHNTPLQLLSECGVLSILAILCVCFWFYWSMRRPGHGKLQLRPRPGPSYLPRVVLLASLSAWLFHNLLDINLYFPSLGSLGVFLLGLFMGIQRGDSIGDSAAMETSLPRQWPPLVSNGQTTSVESESGFIRFRLAIHRWPATVLVAAFLLTGHVVFNNYLAETYYSMALDSTYDRDYESAQKYCRQSLGLRGKNPDCIVLLGKVGALSYLPSGNLSASRLSLLSEAYERAIQIAPYNSDYYFEYSRVLTAMGQEGRALEARKQASRLFPSEPKYRIGESSQSDQNQK